ncbi:MAG: right-handed parallel beta-helix repeat-containing protein [Lentisphaerae bacterium]|nr:right-handed parallel beta-helix repeat-containing protein [Lentisphaerota bacterium]
MKLYIAPNGNDNWSGFLANPKAGKRDGPLATLSGGMARLQRYLPEAAASLQAGAQHCLPAVPSAQPMQAGGQVRLADLNHGQPYRPGRYPVSATPPEPITVYLRGGVYPLEKPLVIGPEHSGVMFKAFAREKPIISGGKRISNWQSASVNGKQAWVADLPEVAAGQWEFRELFVNGRRAARPRLPAKGFYRMEAVPGAVLPSGWDRKHFNQIICRSGDIRNFRNLTDIEMVYLHFWIEERSRISAFDSRTNLVTLERPSLVTPVGAFGKELADYYLDNVWEALCQPGQWYLDRAAGKLYYLPRRGENMKTARIYAPRCLQLLGLIGNPEQNQFVEHVRFEGITFAHTDWRHPDKSDGAAILGTTQGDKTHGRRHSRGQFAAASQAACDVPGVIYFEGARHCALSNCVIEHVGWYGVEISDGCCDISIVGNTMRHLGAGGIKINGAAARDKKAHARRTGQHRITDNTICHGGRVFHSAVGILAMNAYALSICHNHIFDLFYSGVSCGWEWGYQENISRDNLIAFNHIHDLGHKVLSDMGGIYTLGVQPGTVLRNNLIYNVTSAHYGGWCIYPDEGSSYLVIENNVCYDADRQPFHQHYGRENIVRNNIWAFGGESVGIYTRNEPHIGLIWLRNIMVSRGEALFQSAHPPKTEAHRMLSDGNLYFSTAGKPHFLVGGKKCSFKQWQALGRDRHSIVANPKFKSLAQRNFTLSKDSPALKLGFQPIDLSTVGPRPTAQRAEVC